VFQPDGSGPVPGPILGTTRHPDDPIHSQSLNSATISPVAAALASGPVTRAVYVPVRRRLSPAQRTVLVLGTLLCGAAILHAGIDFLTKRTIFRVRPDTVHLSGDLPQALKVEAHQRILAALPPDQSLLETRTSDLIDALKADPRIADISVSLRLPNHIFVTATERIPEAIITTGHSNLFVDAIGNVLRPATPAQLANQDRPFLTGLDPQTVHSGRQLASPMAIMGLQFLHLLRTNHSDIHKRISEIHIHRDIVSHLEALTVHLSTGTEIRMGPGDPVTRIPEILAVLQTIESEPQGLHAIAYIDLTGKGRAAVMDRLTALALHTGLDVENILGLSRTRRGALPGPPLPGRSNIQNTNNNSPATESTANTSPAPATRPRSVYDLNPTPTAAMRTR
jgi:cell division septal protein FtsQ